MFQTLYLTKIKNICFNNLFLYFYKDAFGFHQFGWLPQAIAGSARNLTRRVQACCSHPWAMRVDQWSIPLLTMHFKGFVCRLRHTLGIGPHFPLNGSHASTSLVEPRVGGSGSKREFKESLVPHPFRKINDIGESGPPHFSKNQWHRRVWSPTLFEKTIFNEKICF